MDNQSSSQETENKRTIVIVGPGGIGKSPLDEKIRKSVVRLDPYRLRPNGPRDKTDVLYVPPKIREEIESVLYTLGDSPVERESDEENLKWFPKSRIAIFTVRGEWQILFIPVASSESTSFKLELYAPILPIILLIDEIVKTLGKVKIVVLNPSPISLTSTKSDWLNIESDIEKRTYDNCKKRRDTEESAKKRASSVSIEAPSWKKLIMEHCATEACDWKYSEASVKSGEKDLNEACRLLVRLDPELAEFFDIE